jgi:hypothetical protein
MRLCDALVSNVHDRDVERDENVGDDAAVWCSVCLNMRRATVTETHGHE